MNEETPPEPQELKKELGLGMVVAIGVGGAIGASIFTILGFAAGMAGPAMIIALLIGGGLTLLIGINYSELSATFPESGGGYTFAKKALGGLPAFITGWFMAFANIVFGALSALGFAYVIGFASGIGSSLRIAIAILVVVVFTFLNIRGVEESGKAQLMLVLTLIIGFGVFIGVAHSAIDPFNFQEFTPNGWNGIVHATAFVYVAYFGFETIATVSGEVKNPSRNLPIGTILAVLIITLTYVLIGWVAIGVVHWERLAESGSPLMLVGQVAMGKSFGLPWIGILIIGVLGSIGTLSSVNTAIIASTRVLYALSKDKLLPSELSKLGKHNTPKYATITAAIVMIIFISTGFVDFVAHVADFNLLLALVLVNVSVYFLRRKRPALERPFKSHPLIAFGSAGLMFVLVLFLRPLAIAVGIATALMGVFIYLFKITPSSTRPLTIGGVATGAGAMLLITLGLLDWTIPISLRTLTINGAHFLFVGVILQFIVAFFCVFPIGGLLNLREKGMATWTPIEAEGSEQELRVATVLKNVISGLTIAFALIAILVFYGVFHGVIGLINAYRALISLSLITFAFSATISSIFLFRRKYVIS